jgi:hypothetical protein
MPDFIDEFLQHEETIGNEIKQEQSWTTDLWIRRPVVRVHPAVPKKINGLGLHGGRCWKLPRRVLVLALKSLLNSPAEFLTECREINRLTAT